MLRETKKI